MVAVTGTVVEAVAVVGTRVPVARLTEVSPSPVQYTTITSPAFAGLVALTRLKSVFLSTAAEGAKKIAGAVAATVAVLSRLAEIAAATVGAVETMGANWARALPPGSSVVCMLA